MQIAKFSRDNPCTKVHIFNAFFRDGNFRDTPVVVYRSVAGDNSDKYLKREGYIVALVEKNVDIYRLTTAGLFWLREGLKKHLQLHPGDIPLCRELPSWLGVSAPAKPLVIRRKRPS